MKHLKRLNQLNFEEITNKNDLMETVLINGKQVFLDSKNPSTPDLDAICRKLQPKGSEGEKARQYLDKYLTKLYH